MKVKILSITVFLLIMALLPFAAAKCSFLDFNSVQSVSTADSIPDDNNTEDDSYEKVLCGLVAAKYNDNYCDETIKAIAILLNTDYTVRPDAFDITDKNTCIYEYDSDNSLKEIYSKIKKTVNSTLELTVNKNGKKLYIPYSDSSNGMTIENADYDYLTCVASPWDCYAENYDENAECIGVSINGIDYLCKNGVSAEEALKWYLPDFDISEVK